jgi:streptogramin lyase
MRSGGFHHAFLALLSAVAIVVFTAATAEAAEPATYQLPDATHAESLAAAADRTVWFVPWRGTAWKGGSDSVIGSVSPDGAVAEHEIAGFGAIEKLVLGPADEVWIAGYRDDTVDKRLVEIGRLSPSGELEDVYTVRRGGRIGAMAVADDAIWVVYGRDLGPETIERVPIDGSAVQRFALRQRCSTSALAVGADGALWFAEGCRSNRLGFGRGSIGQIAPDGRISRRPLLGARDFPISLAIGSNRTLWFGIQRWDAAAPLIGRITSAGALAQYRIPNGWPRSIAVDSRGRVWFQSSFGGWNPRALNWIGVGGRLGKPICADPTCQLEATGLISAPDGSLWYGLAKPYLNTGGGGSGMGMKMETDNEAGFIGHLVP